MDDRQRRYDEIGYHFPSRAMDETRAQEYRRRLEAAEVEGDPAKRRLMHLQPAAVLDFVDEIARLPAVVEPVTRILGEDVLLWNATLFIEEPRSPSYISWHQDLKYWGMDGEQHEVTAWLALSNVTTATGCMKFVPGTHKLFHGSSPNASDDRRIGLALRYIATSMGQAAEVRPYAKLVAGEDRYGNFRLIERRPAGVLDERDVALAYENIRVQERFLFAGTRLDR